MAELQKQIDSERGCSYSPRPDMTKPINQKVKGNFESRNKEFMNKKTEDAINKQKELQCDFRPNRIAAVPDSLRSGSSPEPNFEKLYRYREIMDQNKD